VTGPSDAALAAAGRPPPSDQSAAASAVVALLMTAGWTVAVAESLTGGLLGAALTSVPGSSAVFRGGVIAYSTDLKHTLLGVATELLETEGAVATQTARAMADGVRGRLAADCGMATTGVAGPGPQGGHPAGEVHVAVTWPAGTASAVLQLDGDRAAVRSATVDAVLELFTRSVTAVVAAPDRAGGGDSGR